MDFKEIKQKIDKLPDKDKKLYFLYIPLAVLVISATFIFKNSKKDENTVSENIENEAVPLPGVESDGKGHETKSAAYRSLMAKQEKKARTKRLMEEEDFYGYDPENEEDQKETDSLKFQRRRNNSALAEPEKPEVKESTEKKAAPKPQIKYIYRDRKPASSPQKQEKPAVQPEKEETYYGIGVYQASQNSSTQESSGGEFLSAVLEENKKLRDGSQLTFIATSDIKTETGNIPKQSLLFGYVDFMNERIEVHINRVRDTKGKNFPCNLVGYNENFQRGIKYEGKVDKAMERSSNTVVDEVAATSGSATGRLAGRMISNTKDAFKRPPEIFIGKGYRMHFKEKKN